MSPGLFPEEKGKRGITLREFTRRISGLVNAHPDVTDVWVIAELSDFSRHQATGHAYGELIEKDARGTTVAKIRANIWRNGYISLQHKFQAATGTYFQNGMKLLMRLSASHHEQYGLSVQITDVDPNYTLGDLERIRREILEKLQREGILNENKTLDLAEVPQKIAVVSAAGAAGYGDFLKQLEGSGYVFYPLLYPAAMQGVSTANSVMAALDRIEMAVDFWDCVVIIRGGGSTTDLNGFDNLELARRVATYPLPVIVGIGHERDNTVLDYIAHTRCKTPTAVAGFLADRLARAEQRVDQQIQLVASSAQSALQSELRHMARYESLLPVIGPRRLEREETRLANLRNDIFQACTIACNREATRLQTIARNLSTLSTSHIARGEQKLDALPTLLADAVTRRIHFENSRIEAKGNLISVLDPKATLKRGYTITRAGGKAIKSIKEIAPGTTIETTLPDGTILSKTL